MKFQKAMTAAVVTSMLMFGLCVRAAEAEVADADAAIAAPAENCGQQGGCDHKAEAKSGKCDHGGEAKGGCDHKAGEAASEAGIPAAE